MKSDIIIIGGGAAGLVAAIGAARELAQRENGGTVTVLEKMPKAGRKVMITGKGRCNFTNVKDWADFSAHIRTDSNFVSPAWHNLTPEGVRELLRENGLRSVVERGDRAFPESHNAGDVVDTLLRACTLAGVKVMTDCEVKTIDVTPRGFSLDCVQTSRKTVRIPVDDPRKLRPGKPAPTREEITIEPVEYNCRKLIIATGGLSYPGTGSTGDGYLWAEELGHGMKACYPALTALVPAGYKDQQAHPLAGDIKAAFRGRTVYGKSKERKIAPLPKWYPTFPKHIERIVPLTDLGGLFNGNHLENVQLTLFVNGDAVQSEFGDIEFTDGGLEGPLGFMVSRRAVKALNDGQKVAVAIDLKPAVEVEKLNEDIHARWEEIIHDERSKGQSFRRLFRILLGKLIPWELTLAFLDTHGEVSVDTLAAALKDWRMDIDGFVGFERSVITAGGIDTADVVAKTLESRKQKGLYFAGEVLDMDADTGGYNLQLAFCTGYLAGQSAAKSLE
ncbi:MAG: NAD(P)/FAD-dependent oxidoreductase [Bacteroidales bacterium]|nr:NAD(P)/FAD-dependent oxidoreductase [Bacteroidales bacterium]